MAEPATELTLDSASLLAAEEHEITIVGRSPWYLAWRRLRRNWVALVSLGVFILIVVACALAPVYAKHVAHTGPNTVHAGETVIVSGKPKEVIGGGSYYDPKTNKFVVAAAGLPRADLVARARPLRARHGQPRPRRRRAAALRRPQLAHDRDRLGADLHVRRRPPRAARRLLRRLDRLGDHALLRPDLGVPGASCWRSRSATALAINGFHHFGISIEPGSLWIPTLVISYVLIPYIGRPLRGQILSLREKEFVEAAIGAGRRPAARDVLGPAPEHRLARCSSSSR